MLIKITIVDKDHVRLWSPQLRTSHDVLHLSQDRNDIKASTIACKDDVLMVGGNSGEYIFKRLNASESDEHWGNITSDASGITNHIDLIHDRNGGTCNTMSCLLHSFIALSTKKQNKFRQQSSKA
jgi:hypothetical protein